MNTLHALWTAALKTGESLIEDLSNLREHIVAKIETALSQPAAIRGLFRHLREHHPILKLPRLAIVSRYEDVIEVLSQDQIFTVGEIYKRKMEATTGDFILGYENGPVYLREATLMRQAVLPEDIDRVKTLTAEYSSLLVAQAVPRGRIDVVDGLSRVTPTRLIETYFGIPIQSETQMQRWMRILFHEIFVNIGNEPNVAADASLAGKELAAYLDAVIVQRKIELESGHFAGDDFLTRLIKMQLDPANNLSNCDIRRFVGGTIVGTVDTNSRAMAQGFDQLLDRPVELEGARQAALNDDDELLSKYIYEAMRFNPQNPILFRHCSQDYTVARGTDREKTIPAGDLVVAGTLSAMFDESKFPEPETFRLDRPFQNYILYGYGQHECFGKHISTAMIPQTLKPLLKLPNIKRAPGDDGQLKYEGAFPNNLWVEFGE